MSAARAKRRNQIVGQFTIRLVEMVESPAYRALSLSGHRVLSRIEIELRHHGGNENGRLTVTFKNFEDYGIHRHAIGLALAEVEALGFIAITEHGTKAKAAEYRRANKFCLTTYPELEGVGPEGCRWRRFKTLEEAVAAAERARTAYEEKKKNEPVRKPHRRPVRKPYCNAEKASAETAPLQMAETAPLSISRVGEQHGGTLLQHTARGLSEGEIDIVEPFQASAAKNSPSARPGRTPELPAPKERVRA